MAFEKKEDGNAPFNMAFNTFERLGETLRDIRIATANPGISQEIKQDIRIKLHKQFYINAVPLLKVEQVEKYKYLLRYSMKQTKVMSNEQGAVAFKRFMKVYDEALDIKLDEALINIQLDLQAQGFFMPSGKDPRYSWGSGD